MQTWNLHHINYTSTPFMGVMKNTYLSIYLPHPPISHFCCIPGAQERPSRVASDITFTGAFVFSFPPLIMDPEPVTENRFLLHLVLLLRRLCAQNLHFWSIEVSNIETVFRMNVISDVLLRIWLAHRWFPWCWWQWGHKHEHWSWHCSKMHHASAMPHQET